MCDIAVLGPKRTCFCWARCTSSICERSISNNTGANKIADELKNNHAAEHENAYKPERKRKFYSLHDQKNCFFFVNLKENLY